MHTRVALVTGASRGIGRAIAVELARAGFAVGVNYVQRMDQAEETVAAITAGGGEAAPLQADVADPQAVEAMFAALDRRFGRLDALVNNAGIGTRIESLAAIDDATWRRTLAVNLDGAFYCMRAAVPRLRAAGGGRIVNISSGAARGYPESLPCARSGCAHDRPARAHRGWPAPAGRPCATRPVATAVQPGQTPRGARPR